MRKPRPRSPQLLVGWVLLGTLASAVGTHGQGSLTPPGAPAPTMKSLDQIEARTIVNAINTPGDATSTFIISQPGSYYLTSNLVGDAGKHGISIRADDVTLDLNGFTLTGLAPASGTVRGIDVPVAQRNFCLRNGTVRGWNGGGVRADATTGALIELVRALENAGAPGIFLGLGGLARDCVATANGTGFQSGDRAQFVGCIATINTSAGFLCSNFVSIIDCTASRNAGMGIQFGGSCSIQRCSATRNDVNGFDSLGVGSTLGDCTAGSNGADGFCCPNGNRFVGCTASYNAAAGIDAYGGSVVNCSALFNGTYGIRAVYGSVANCHATSNGESGIIASRGSVSNSVATHNGHDGITADNGVIAYCAASSNNQDNNGGQDIAATGTTRTGNNPAP